MNIIKTLLNAFGIQTADQKALSAKKSAVSKIRSDSQKAAWVRKKAQLNLPL